MTSRHVRMFTKLKVNINKNNKFLDGKLKFYFKRLDTIIYNCKCD